MNHVSFLKHNLIQKDGDVCRSSTFPRPVVEERLQEMTTRWQYVPTVTNGMSRVINRRNTIDVFP